MLASVNPVWHSDQVVRVTPSPLGKLLARHSETSVSEALTDTRVVLVTGARQCGKSTLLGLVAKGREAEWRNLDAAATRQAARPRSVQPAAGDPSPEQPGDRPD